VHEFIPGQRWISESELQMGLGTVLSTDHRTVTIVFLSTGETRIYAKQSAPLSRVSFTAGDKVKTHEGWCLTIHNIEEHNGLYTYHGRHDDGTSASIGEGELDNFIQLNRPIDRLLTGQIDRGRWFELRYQTLQEKNLLAHSDLRGLIGVRTSLIPHQLYIAHEVANRYAPRVLLADEVGLGKTIEAGLVLHQQLLTERARRILIVVPESLVHQWLVEMLRRFNLYFSIFDDERCEAVEQAEQSDTPINPFQTEQLVLCKLEFLVANPTRAKQCLAGEWDLLVVDEAHHLQWSATDPSPEYLIVERLAAVTKGVLLLTATPEQLGKQSHFARLRLLDADRFPDFDTFVEEEQHYEPVARAVEALLSGEDLSDTAYQTLHDTIGEGDNQALLDILQQSKQATAAQQTDARLELVEHLLDRHGTGRVLFRNTRAAVKGFPARTATLTPLPLPDAYKTCLSTFQTTSISVPQLLLCPELLYQADQQSGQPHWTEIDPRVEWLAQQLKTLKPAKVLVIAAGADTALDLEQVLRTRSGIHAAVFHEGLSIVERDRAAAFFADTEYGSQVLICSEIGSEGRNFQFAHHLILFDLPLNPDLLEQRIGRLDRIGQTETIRLHIPYLDNSGQAIMARWYHEGLNAFEQTCPAGHSVFVKVEQDLLNALHQLEDGLEDLPNLLSATAGLHHELNEALHKGRDQLLEYNSCRPALANELCRRGETEARQVALSLYLENIFNCFEIESEPGGEGNLVIHPGHHMQGNFPNLPEDGMTLTYDRETALTYEDIHYMTWEHPFVTDAMDLVMNQEQGNTALTAIKTNQFKAGTLLLECIYVLEAGDSSELQASRYLPPTTIRVVVDEHGNNRTDVLPHDAINRGRIKVNQETAKQVVRSQVQAIRELVGGSDQLAKQAAPAILQEAHAKTRQTLEKEINRLKALQQVNPNVRDDEISFFETQWRALDKILDATNLRLDAIRVVVTT